LLLHYLDESVRAAPDEESSVAEDELTAWVAGVEESGTKLYGGELRPSRDLRAAAIPRL